MSERCTAVVGCVRCAKPCALVGDLIPDDALCPWCRGGPTEGAPSVSELMRKDPATPAIKRGIHNERSCFHCGSLAHYSDQCTAVPRATDPQVSLAASLPTSAEDERTIDGLMAGREVVVRPLTWSRSKLIELHDAICRPGQPLDHDFFGCALDGILSLRSHSDWQARMLGDVPSDELIGDPQLPEFAPNGYAPELHRIVNAIMAADFDSASRGATAGDIVESLIAEIKSMSTASPVAPTREDGEPKTPDTTTGESAGTQPERNPHIGSSLDDFLAEQGEPTDPLVKCNRCGAWLDIKRRDSKPNASWYAEPCGCIAAHSGEEQAAQPEPTAEELFYSLERKTLAEGTRTVRISADGMRAIYRAGVASQAARIEELDLVGRRLLKVVQELSASVQEVQVSLGLPEDSTIESILDTLVELAAVGILQRTETTTTSSAERPHEQGEHTEADCHPAEGFSGSGAEDNHGNYEQSPGDEVHGPGKMQEPDPSALDE